MAFVFGLFASAIGLVITGISMCLAAVPRFLLWMFNTMMSFR